MFDFKSHTEMELVAKTHEAKAGSSWAVPAPKRRESPKLTRVGLIDGILWMSPIFLLIAAMVARFYFGLEPMQ